MNFWIIISSVTLIICSIAFYPLFKNHKNLRSQKRDSLNKAFYFDRLNEVAREESIGIIDDSVQTKYELQQSLLDDIPADNNQPVGFIPSSEKIGKIWFIALLLIASAISVSIYWNVGSWFSNTMLEMSHKKLDYFYERIKSESSETLSEQELNQFVMALRVELQHKPQDDKTLLTLGLVGMQLENWQLALDCFAKASQLQPENIQYKLYHAEVLFFSQDPKDKERGDQLVKEILRVDHTNLKALSLLAFRSFEQENYNMAAITWGMMLKLMPENDPRRTTIERSMQSAISLSKKLVK